MDFDDLHRAYASGELVAFVGSGLSEAAGLPSGRGLVEHMLGFARDYGLYPSQIVDIEELVADAELARALSEIERAISKRAFTRAITRALDDHGRPIPSLAQAIAGLGDLRGVITTNLDRVLERALAGRWPCYARPVASFAQIRGWCFKLHGTLAERDTWVLTHEEHQRAIYHDAAHQRLFEALFLATPLVFIGYGYADPDFRALTDRIAALTRDQPPNHFALIEAGELDERRRRRLADVGIHALAYRDDAELLQRVRELGD